MNSVATHVLLDGYDIPASILNDADALETILRSAALAAQCTILGVLKHQFEPHGVSVVLMVSESHLSVHTWPEHRYAAFDFFTCGKAVASQGVIEVKKLIPTAQWIESRQPRGLALSRPVPS